MTKNDYIIIKTIEVDIKNERKIDDPKELEKIINKILKNVLKGISVEYYCDSQTEDWTFIFLGKYENGYINSKNVERILNEKLSKYKNISKIKVELGLTMEEIK